MTLRLDDRTQERFEGLRMRYFPPERNLIGAHLTLFHTLPEADWVREELVLACGAMRRFEVEVDGLRSLGKGVAYTVRSVALMELHGRLAKVFARELSAQDRQKFQPHVVVQNKVTAEAARELLGFCGRGSCRFRDWRWGWIFGGISGDPGVPGDIPVW